MTQSVALVTGAARGIGLATTKLFLEEGRHVVMVDRDGDALLPEAEALEDVTPIVRDVSIPSEVEAILGQVTEDIGRVDALVNNAGVADFGPIEETTFDRWRTVMATNLDGAFLTIRECFNSMHPTSWGRVLVISSIAGVHGLKGGAAYSASKHGVIGLVRSMSEDFMGSEFTFNAICPGYVDTDIVSRNVDLIQKRAGVDADKAMQLMVSANRHGRLIHADEIAKAALWLCMPGSESVNGQEIKIAGGQI